MIFNNNNNNNNNNGCGQSHMSIGKDGSVHMTNMSGNSKNSITIGNGGMHMNNSSHGGRNSCTNSININGSNNGCNCTHICTNENGVHICTIITDDGVTINSRSSKGNNNITICNSSSSFQNWNPNKKS